jgi:hypothetical protein
MQVETLYWYYDKKSWVLQFQQLVSINITKERYSFALLKVLLFNYHTFWPLTLCSKLITINNKLTIKNVHINFIFAISLKFYLVKSSILVKYSWHASLRQVWLNLSWLNLSSIQYICLAILFVEIIWKLMSQSLPI